MSGLERKGVGSVLFRFFPALYSFSDHTQPVGLGNPAILHAPLAGPLGKSS